MRLALRLVAIQHCGQQPSLHHGCQLPCEVGRIAHAAVHALPCKRRRQVRGIARQKHTAHLPAFSHTGVKGVDNRAGNFKLCIVRVAVGNQATHHALFDDFFRVFSRVEHELVAQRALWPRQANGRAYRVAVGTGVAKRRCAAE